jgi:hypothetical protein
LDFSLLVGDSYLGDEDVRFGNGNGGSDVTAFIKLIFESKLRNVTKGIN